MSTEKQKPSEHQQSNQKGRVLAVDDDHAILEIYEDTLGVGSALSLLVDQGLSELSGLSGYDDNDKVDADSEAPKESFELVTTDQGLDAVKLVKQALEVGNPFSVAFVDIRIPPGIDGLETAIRLRELDPRIYIVFVTAYSDHDLNQIDRSLNYGVFFVTKPFGQEMMIQMTRSLLRIWNNDRLLEGSVSRAELEYAQKLVNEKDKFFAAMSHELRTPLTTIIGNSDILSEGELNDDQSQLLESIEISGKSLLSLVNDILDLSKIEAGKFEINYAPFDLAMLLHEIESIFMARSRNSGLKFNIKQIELTHKVWGDGKRIGQILINLLSNAVKFTEQGHVTLTVWLDRSLYFSVEDTGIGMNKEALDRLFQPFEQANSTISRRFGGTGLGLHISWSLAELMKGEIQVTSQEGEGSQFILKLPYKESDLPIDTVKKVAKQQSAQYRGEVLIAEDTPELQQLESRILRSMGATVTIANNGQEAVDLVINNHYDLVFMDMMMPVMGGLEATQALRALGSEVPVIALTANVMQEHREQFIAAGAEGFLEKPINKNQLNAILQQHLKSDKPYISTQNHPQQKGTQRNINHLLMIDDEPAVLDTYQTIFMGETASAPLNSMDKLLSPEGTNPPASLGEFSISIANQGRTGVNIAREALEKGKVDPISSRQFLP